VTPADVPSAKWIGYDPDRLARLTVLQLVL
jgi:hypothetical protein